MTAYAVGLYNMRERDWTNVYKNPVTELIGKRGGRYLVRASTCQWEMMEGNAPAITGITLIEFPSMDAARAWHADPEYQQYIRLRQAGSQLDLILVEDPMIS